MENPMPAAQDGDRARSQGPALEMARRTPRPAMITTDKGPQQPGPARRTHWPGRKRGRSSFRDGNEDEYQRLPSPSLLPKIQPTTFEESRPPYQVSPGFGIILRDLTQNYVD